MSRPSSATPAPISSPWAPPRSAAAIDLAGGSDTLTLGNFANSATVANVETITGGTGADSITLGTALTTAMAVDLGAGADKLTLANLANTGTVRDVETLMGGTGADAITSIMSSAQAVGSVDLGAGSDTLTLANLALTPCRSPTSKRSTAATGDDTVTLGTAASNASIDLGTGGDKLTLGAFANTATVANIETLIGGSGARHHHLAPLCQRSVDLGAGPTSSPSPTAPTPSPQPMSRPSLAAPAPTLSP